MFIAMIGVSVPSFILGAVLQYFLGLQLRKVFGMNIFPIQGWGTFKHTLLPAFALGLGSLATVSRLMRTSMLDVLSSDYIKTARSKGLSQNQILWRHALRNALIPIITVLGPLIVNTMTGSLVIEKIFAIPGIGELMVRSIQQNDYNVTIALSFVYSVMYIGIMLAVDILYGIIDPRIRLSKGDNHES